MSTLEQADKAADSVFKTITQTLYPEWLLGVGVALDGDSNHVLVRVSDEGEAAAAGIPNEEDGVTVKIEKREPDIALAEEAEVVE